MEDKTQTLAIVSSTQYIYPILIKNAWRLQPLIVSTYSSEPMISLKQQIIEQIAQVMIEKSSLTLNSFALATVNSQLNLTYIYLLAIGSSNQCIDLASRLSLSLINNQNLEYLNNVKAQLVAQAGERVIAVTGSASSQIIRSCIKISSQLMYPLAENLVSYSYSPLLNVASKLSEKLVSSVNFTELKDGLGNLSKQSLSLLGRLSKKIINGLANFLSRNNEDVTTQLTKMQRNNSSYYNIFLSGQNALVPVGFPSNPIIPINLENFLQSKSNFSLNRQEKEFVFEFVGNLCKKGMKTSQKIVSFYLNYKKSFYEHQQLLIEAEKIRLELKHYQKIKKLLSQCEYEEIVFAKQRELKKLEIKIQVLENKETKTCGEIKIHLIDLLEDYRSLIAEDYQYEAFKKIIKAEIKIISRLDEEYPTDKEELFFIFDEVLEEYEPVHAQRLREILNEEWEKEIAEKNERLKQQKREKEKIIEIYESKYRIRDYPSEMFGKKTEKKFLSEEMFHTNNIQSLK